MQKQWKVLLIAGVAAGLGAGCASRETKRELDSQVQAEPARTPSEIAKEMNDKLLTNPNLTDKQKAELQDLRDRSRVEIAQTRVEYSQTQSLLIQKLADPKAKLSEISYLKQKMKKLGYKQTDVALNAISRATEIVGKKIPLDHDFYQPFLEPDGNSPSYQVK